MTRFRSRPDAEECLCTSCQRKGYGDDAWHPCTAQFWPTTHGRLIYTRCKACASESARHARGIVTAEARIRVPGRACPAAYLRGDDESARRIWVDYKAAHAMSSPEVVAVMERRMGVR